MRVAGCLEFRPSSCGTLSPPPPRLAVVARTAVDDPRLVLGAELRVGLRVAGDRAGDHERAADGEERDAERPEDVHEVPSFVPARKCNGTVFTEPLASRSRFQRRRGPRGRAVQIHPKRPLARSTLRPTAVKEDPCLVRRMPLGRRCARRGAARPGCDRIGQPSLHEAPRRCSAASRVHRTSSTSSCRCTLGGPEHRQRARACSFQDPTGRRDGTFTFPGNVAQRRGQRRPSSSRPSRPPSSSASRPT